MGRRRIPSSLGRPAPRHIGRARHPGAVATVLDGDEHAVEAVGKTLGVIRHFASRKLHVWASWQKYEIALRVSVYSVRHREYQTMSKSPVGAIVRQLEQLAGPAAVENL